jgi:hypothetical protein
MPARAMRFEKAAPAPACGIGCRPPTISRSRAKAKQRLPCAFSRGRFDVRRFRPAAVEGIADRTTIETSRKRVPL